MMNDEGIYEMKNIKEKGTTSVRVNFLLGIYLIKVKVSMIS